MRKRLKRRDKGTDVEGEGHEEGRREQRTVSER